MGLLLVTVLIWTFGEMAYSSIVQAHLVTLTPPGMVGRYQGLYGAAYTIGTGAGPVIGGAVYAIAPWALWTVVGVLGLVCAQLSLWLRRPAGAAIENHSLGSAVGAQTLTGSRYIGRAPVPHSARMAPLDDATREFRDLRMGTAEVAPRATRVTRPRRTVVAVVAGAFVLASVGVGTAVVGIGGWGGVAKSTTDAPRTARVSLGTFNAMHVVPGSLGYGEATTLKSRTPGTVTWLPAPGVRVVRGQAVYRNDDVPTVLIYGSLPMYRTLGRGAIGPDVAQLEQNLRALGYKDLVVDEKYTAGTAAAVRKWQKALGITATGTVSASAVHVAAGEIRVAARSAQVAEFVRQGSAILTYTGSSQVVTADLDARLRHEVAEGAEVTVEMPDKQARPGRVARVGTVATPARGNSDGTIATIKVVITMASPNTADGFDEAPVRVRFGSSKRRESLAVPVGALIPDDDHTYTVRLVDGDSSRVVTVRVGATVDGKAEISGEGIAAGDTVELR
jgi:peptidoglycan hydrolase-like protein with peptidoglycan-binding domain